MPIYKQDAAGKFVPFERTPFPDLEKVLEDWIEANPHLVLEGEDLVIIARQPRTGFDKFLDLLAIDKTGAAIVIELKRGETPRDVVAQALEYAAWVDSLNAEQLDDMARDYCQRRKLGSMGLAELYERQYSKDGEESEADTDRPADRVTFNNRQRIVIVAERISDEVEQTLRYLRTRLGAEIYGVEFSIHKAAGETIISTTTKVGREQVSKTSQTSVQRERESDESITARVKTDFMKRAVFDLESWVAKSGLDGLSVDHSTGSNHWVRYEGETWIYYYYAANWLYMSLNIPKADEVERLRPALSEPDSLWTKEGRTVRFHVATDGDPDAVKELIVSRIRTRQAGG